MKQYDTAIIGGGVLGFSIGIKILRENPKSSVIIYERNNRIFAEASGRNSGVLHAGFYYSPDSLKAAFTASGNFELKTLLKKHDVKINECGKIVVARTFEEAESIKLLHSRAQVNGVQTEVVTSIELEKLEPVAKTHEIALWSPTTAVANPTDVTEAFRSEFRLLGGEVECNAICGINRAGVLKVNGQTVQALRIFNAAGSGALKIAKANGVAENFSILTIMGRYRVTENSKIGMSRLIYPVPPKENPFLGIHFTLVGDNEIKIGPTALPTPRSLIMRELNLDTFIELKEFMKAARALTRNATSNILRLYFDELSHITTKQMVKTAQEMTKSDLSKETWSPKRGGFRSQLVDLELGCMVQDFIILRNNRVVHVLNAVSPGWTAALSFARRVVEISNE